MSRIACSRCGRAVSFYSDEYEDWTWVQGDGDPYPVCLTPKEAEGFVEALHELQRIKRLLSRKRR